MTASGDPKAAASADAVDTSNAAGAANAAAKSARVAAAGAAGAETTNAASNTSPVSQSERLVILDSLRGIAILGILLMNIPGFGFAEVIVTDPSVLNETGINYQTLYVIDWSLEGTQRALFSMLFGASMILFISRQEKKLSGILPAEYYFRRQLWLLLFGLFNGFVLLWFWDILFHYAIAGMILFAFRRLTPKSLLMGAAICLVLSTAFDNISLYDKKLTIRTGQYIARIDTTKTPLTDQQRNDLKAMNEFFDNSTQEAKLEKVNTENKAILGSYAELFRHQSDKTVEAEMKYTYYGMWDVLLFMLVGMAFYKNGWLLGKAPSWIYWLMFIGGFGLGLPISYCRLQSFIDAGFNEFYYTRDVSFTYYEVSRLFRSFGFFGLVMLLYKSGVFNWLFALMRPVGQMAFTNYLLQSLIAGIYFYGIGFGNFGNLERHELYYFVGAVWVFQIMLSHIWLKYFRFGPFEWLWRSLTYWKRQPLFRSNTPTANAAATA
ncbi:MAG TPA: DUF418 domain-containing protein [Chitinophagaceae bacterium]|nr:DUF418 domain-containing protein [Chitinophagaceae bacterium]